MMPDYLASYDLKNTTPSPHYKFLEQSRKNGWNYWILSKDQIWYRLPNTTLIGTFASMDAAEAAFEKTKQAASNELGQAVTVEKFIIVQYSTARSNSDEKQAKS